MLALSGSLGCRRIATLLTMQHANPPPSTAAAAASTPPPPLKHQHRFAADFPSVDDVPLQLDAEQRAAFEADVRPMLDLAERAAAASSSSSPSSTPAPTQAELAAALRALAARIGADARRYAALRGAADYVQAAFAQCAVDAAAAWALGADRRAFRAALARAGGEAAVDAALGLELRARLVAAGCGDLTAPMLVSLRHAGGDAGASGGSNGSEAAVAPNAVPLFGALAAGMARGEALVQAGGARLAWPALRRALSAAGGHAVEAVLGRDASDPAAGAIVLTGAGLTAAMLGVRLPGGDPARAGGDGGAGGDGRSAGVRALTAGLPHVDAPPRWLDLAIVGATGGPAAAARAVQGCARELLSRHKARHAGAPATAADGRPLRPLVLVTRRALVFLLPEGGGGGGVSAGAGAGGAAGGGGGGGRRRDVAVRVRLALARDVEELLLPTPLPAPSADEPPAEGAGAGAGGDDAGGHACCASTAAPLAPQTLAWWAAAAYDGDDAAVLAPCLPALSSGRLALDPARLHAAAAGVAKCLADAGSGEQDDEATMTTAAAVRIVRSLALAGWRPEALLPAAASDGGGGGGGGGARGGVLGALLAASAAADADEGEPASSAAAAELPAAKAAALVNASMEGVAVAPEALRAILGSGGGDHEPGSGGSAAAAAGAAARARELRRALRESHGWEWQEVAADDAAAELPPALAELVAARLRAPRERPLAPEPLDGDVVAAGPAWFYGD